MQRANADSAWNEEQERADEEFRSRVELLATLGKSLHEVGVPAHRLETMLQQTADRLAVSVELFSLPTGLMMSVEGDPPATVLMRIGLGVTHLERLVQLSAVTRAITRGALKAVEAKRYVDRIMRAPARWGYPSTVLAYVLSAGAFSVFFGGELPEVGIAICVGLAVGLISVSMKHYQASPRLFELTSAAAASVIAEGGYALSSDFVEWIPLASGLIILLPGLALVDAVDELAHGQLTSGASRLAGVGVVLLAMAFGAVLGVVLITPVVNEALPVKQAVQPWWWLIIALVAVAAGSVIRFRARMSDFWSALVGSTVALAGSRLGAYELGPLAGPFLAALLLGTTGNIFARLVRQPAQLITVPGLALLVPGSFGVRSMEALLSNETNVGVDTAFHMFLTAMALVSGLLASNSFFRQRPV